MKALPIVLLSLTIVCSSLQCLKTKPRPKPSKELPAITHEGKNTFGCKINGEVWVPFYKCGFGRNECGELWSDFFRISATGNVPIAVQIMAVKDYADKYSSFHFSSKYHGGLWEGISTTGNKIDSIKIQYREPGSSLPYYNIPGLTTNGKIEITHLDTVNKVIAGIFEGTLYKNLNDSIHVTEGRFDLKYNTCHCSN